MRCYICDAILSKDEAQYAPHNDRHKWEPCGSCLAQIDEVYDDPLSEEEIDRLIEWEEETGALEALEESPDISEG